MNVLHFDKQNKIGPFKVMNAVNNGPCHKRHATNQWKSNLDTYKAARIPFARNHDAAFHAGYGGEHSVDITAIFPNFDADPYDPTSYDFACTDEYILITLEAGTETYYRLGQKIEHYIKKFDTIPPKDFHKWAVMTAAQHSSVDMLMYYDARPTVFNGMFDFYTLRPLKGYYPFLWYGMLYDMEAEIACTGDLPENLYALRPTAHHLAPELRELCERFVELKTDKPQLLYIWGHSYELDLEDKWQTLESLFSLLSGRDDIVYGTNAEVLRLLFP